MNNYLSYFQVDSVTGKEYTYQTLIDYTENISTALLDRGLCKGDIVCIFAGNCVEFIFLMMGIICAGGIMTTINPLYTVGKQLILVVRYTILTYRNDYTYR